MIIFHLMTKTKSTKILSPKSNLPNPFFLFFNLKNTQRWFYKKMKSSVLRLSEIYVLSCTDCIPSFTQVSTCYKYWFTTNDMPLLKRLRYYMSWPYWFTIRFTLKTCHSSFNFQNLQYARWLLHEFCLTDHVVSYSWFIHRRPKLQLWDDHLAH